MKPNELNRLTVSLKSTAKMPVLFLGHGSPMNAIEDNEFSRSWQQVAKAMPRPLAVLCISAHWETRGTYVTAMQRPPTIHDFGGFPPALFDVQYPAPGDIQLATDTQNVITKTTVEADMNWGLDHGCWSVLKHMYPEADVPVVEMSLDYSQSPHYHFELAGQLSTLREKGVLVIGSGNMVHNLRVLDWNKPDVGFDWAQEANIKMMKLILDGNFKQLFNYKSLGPEVERSVPTPEHFLPLIYALGLKRKNEDIAVFNDKLVMGAISMTSLQIG